MPHTERASVVSCSVSVSVYLSHLLSLTSSLSHILSKLLSLYASMTARTHTETASKKDYVRESYWERASAREQLRKIHRHRHRTTHHTPNIPPPTLHIPPSPFLNRHQHLHQPDQCHPFHFLSPLHLPLLPSLCLVGLVTYHSYPLLSTPPRLRFLVPSPHLFPIPLLLPLLPLS